MGSNSKKVFSFDVFDTCLARLCGEPRLLFDVLSLKVQQAMGENCNEHMRQLFVASRINAGGRSLEEIYRNVIEDFPIPYTVEQMAELEMEAEREMLVPIVATRELVNQARSKGKVLFISDMYLPSSFIKDRLTEFGFFQESDLLFVSDELQAWKYDGSLYRLIHDRYNIPYSHWHHYGDNYGSDYKTPCHLGIHAHYLHYDYLPYEEKWRQQPVLKTQYPSILAGIARAVRISTDAPDDQKAFVCDVSAPLMISWVLYVLNDAQIRGIRRLYFCARDVHTQYLIARKLQPLFPNLEVRYLFISRMALYESKFCYDYLEQEGVASNDSVAIVDSASSGKTLYTMNQLLLEHNRPVIWGYFMQLTDNGIKNRDPHSDYLISTPYLETLPLIILHKFGGMTNFYEPFFSFNLHAPTIGYESRNGIIRPVFGSCSNKDESWGCTQKNFRNIKAANDILALKMADALCTTDINLFYYNILTHIALPTLADFISVPCRRYLKYLTRFLWWGRPFVGSLHGKRKGIWKRGNLFYSLPGFITSPLRHILSNDRSRRKLNRSLACLSR